MESAFPWGERPLADHGRILLSPVSSGNGVSVRSSLPVFAPRLRVFHPTLKSRSAGESSTLVKTQVLNIGSYEKQKRKNMRRNKLLSYCLSISAVLGLTSGAMAQPAGDGKKPNILFIMGDDIGWMQVGCYHEGLSLGETPNIDRLAAEGGRFMCYYAEQSCTAGRNAFLTGMHPLRTGMIPPQLPGSPSFLQPGTPTISQFLYDLGYSTGEFGKNHLGDHPARLADGSRLSGILGLSLSLGRHAAGEFPGHQQQPDRAGCLPAVHAGADSRNPANTGRD